VSNTQRARAKVVQLEQPVPPNDLEKALAFLRRRLTGAYETDDFGFDHDLSKNVVMPALRPFFERYWRVEQRGTEHLPVDGPAILVANHSGTLPIDALMMSYGVHQETGRHVRLLAADLALKLPVIGQLSRKSGSTLACPEDAMRLLRSGQLVGVCPEGYKGLGKPFRQRYRLQRFGRGGFAEVAIEAGVPVIPVAIVGAEEIYPMVADLKPLARLFGLPYFPVTPLFPLLGPLGVVPLPSRWIITYGEPIMPEPLAPDEALDPMTVFNFADRVREEIQQMLYRALATRRSVFR
jgi:1-acyl-sn-glycerol-3-phosphate acyltransferase